MSKETMKKMSLPVYIVYLCISFYNYYRTIIVVLTIITIIDQQSDFNKKKNIPEKVNISEHYYDVSFLSFSVSFTCRQSLYR